VFVLFCLSGIDFSEYGGGSGSSTIVSIVGIITLYFYIFVQINSIFVFDKCLINNGPNTLNFQVILTIKGRSSGNRRFSE